MALEEKRKGLVKLIPPAVSVYTLLSGLVVLAGWALNSERLKTWDMIGPPMNPLTAVILLLCGSILFLFISGNLKLVKWFAVSIVLLILGNYISSFTGYYLDEILFSQAVKSEHPYNHIALPTSLSLLLLGGSFLLLINAHYRSSQIVSFLVFFISLFVFIAYIYGSRPLYFFPDRMPMALNTSITLMLLSSGTILLGWNRGYVKEFTAATTGSRSARRLLPMILITLVALGYVRLQFSDNGILVAEAGLAAFIAFTVCLFIVVLYYYSFRINKAECKVEQEKKQIRHLNKKLHEKNKLLMEKNADLERFAYSVAHDLRSPLSGVKNLSSKILEEGGNLTQEQKEWIELICSTSDSLIERTTRMLELARAGKKSIRRAPVHTEQLVEQVVSEIQAGSEEKKISIRTEKLPVIMGDKDLLKTVFYNLVSNAVKYSPGELAEVFISSRRKGKEVIFSIRDKGIGINMKTISALFKTFSRLPGAEKISGTGLGLSIVKRIIERHGGKVWAKPSMGGGAVFFFSLPA